MVVSFSFLELGQDLLASGNVWLTPICLRSSKFEKAMRVTKHTRSPHHERWSHKAVRLVLTISTTASSSALQRTTRRSATQWADTDPRVRGDLHKVCGGWPHCFRLFLRLMLMGHHGLSTSGVVVNVKGEDVLLYGRLCAMLGDGEGHAKSFDWKGASSMKPCLRHFNVYRKVFSGVWLLSFTINVESLTSTIQRSATPAASQLRLSPRGSLHHASI
jgi:hypothetical protein